MLKTRVDRHSDGSPTDDCYLNWSDDICHGEMNLTQYQLELLWERADELIQQKSQEIKIAGLGTQVATVHADLNTSGRISMTRIDESVFITWTAYSEKPPPTTFIPSPHRNSWNLIETFEDFEAWWAETGRLLRHG